jgi:hypothetical protein
MIKKEHVILGAALMSEVKKYLKKYKLSVHKSGNDVNNLGITPELALSIMIVDMSEQATIEDDEIKKRDN